MSNVAVFYSPFKSCFQGRLVRYFLNDFETVPVAPITNGHHMLCVSIVRTLYFKIVSISLFITFRSPEIKTCYFLIITFYDARFIVRNNCWILLYEDCRRRNKNLSIAWID